MPAPGYLVYIGDEKILYPVILGLFHNISHEIIRIPIN